MRAASPLSRWCIRCRGLAKGFPGVAWFSIFQLAFLWLATAVVVKSFARGAQRRGLPVWLGALFGVGQGGRAVDQLPRELYHRAGFHRWAGDTDKAVRRGLLLSVLLLVLCYFLRHWVAAILAERRGKRDGAPSTWWGWPCALGRCCCSQRYGWSKRA